VRVLNAAGIDPAVLGAQKTSELPFVGALAKSEQDSALLARALD
jgi:hypothetical protein